jgi:uncharacterized protein DUF3106
VRTSSSILLALLALALSAGAQQPPQSTPNQAATPARPAGRMAEGGAAQQRHRGQPGAWLRRYKDLPPDQQEKALENDPEFKNLPPERQAQLRQRLQQFNSLPPERKDKIVHRMEAFHNKPPQQRQQLRDLTSRMRALPVERHRPMRQALHQLSQMPPDQQQKTLDSPQFKSQFSDDERDILRGLAQLKVRPAQERLQEDMRQQAQ